MSIIYLTKYRVRPNTFLFFLENALKQKLVNIFLNFHFYLKVSTLAIKENCKQKFNISSKIPSLITGPPNIFIYLKVQSFRLIMENNFIQMAVSARQAAAYTIGPIFKHIIVCKQLYFTNTYIHT